MSFFCNPWLFFVTRNGAATWRADAVPTTADFPYSNIAGTVSVTTAGAVADAFSLDGGTLAIETGGALNLTQGGGNGWSGNIWFGLTGSLIMNGGTLTTLVMSAKELSSTTVGLHLNGGTINCTNNIILGNTGNSENPVGWCIANHTGTIVNASDLTLGNPDGSSVYTISGGTLNLGASLGIGQYDWGGVPTTNTLQVVGSGSTIHVGGWYIAGGRGTSQFLLDNSAQHITTVGTAFVSQEGGTVSMGLNGGVMLSVTVKPLH